MRIREGNEGQRGAPNRRPSRGCIGRVASRRRPCVLRRTTYVLVGAGPGTGHAPLRKRDRAGCPHSARFRTPRQRAGAAPTALAGGLGPPDGLEASARVSNVSCSGASGTARSSRCGALGAPAEPLEGGALLLKERLRSAATTEMKVLSRASAGSRSARRG